MPNCSECGGTLTLPGQCAPSSLCTSASFAATRFRAIPPRRYGPPKIPAPTTNIFVERKTHHEKWTGEESVKERFGRSWWHPLSASGSRVAVHKLFVSPHGTFVIASATDFPLSKLPRFLSNDPNVVRVHFSHMVDDGELTAAKAEERAAFACEVQPGIARLKPKVGHLHRCSKGR